MRLNRAIAEATERLIAGCGLDTASIFFCDHASDEGSVSYLHHVAVSSEAQYAYSHHRLFRSDPFVALTRRQQAERGPGFVRWGDARLDLQAEQHRDYHAFLNHHGLVVTGALGRRISSQVSLIIGLHRHANRRHGSEVPMQTLESWTTELSELVIEGLFEQMLAQEGGRRILAPSTEALPVLAQRESQITAMICQGLRNKEISWRLGISEYTVENHLRRIYRKLGIHNRAALVSRYSNQFH
ncbi:helix-turn-helix transcriptional regulator [Novosphingobium rosa]|uniref:helix-turn-helix transcriptional regulator n=1 Tax=Novosphingobium rosa TaxID=76978 RepID=UPI001472193C|nr:helix-turn-helix transcriptional regulator [Novosphingobium rosa]